jgi:cephalosporin hydroxylase
VFSPDNEQQPQFMDANPSMSATLDSTAQPPKVEASLTSTARGLVRKVQRRVQPFWYGKVLKPFALTALVWRTGNFVDVRWLGHPILQNPLDAWGLQEALVSDEVDLVVECGTNRGGSAFYMASIFDLLGRGHVITIDVASIVEVTHPRVAYIIGSSVDQGTLDRVRTKIQELQPNKVMVLLDSDHAGAHVLRELEMYAQLVPVGGYVLVQDGCIDELRIMRRDRPGPLWAIRQFVKQDSRFVIDKERSDRFLLVHSPSGWLRRVA